MEEKKSERLEVRLGYQEKSKFVDACDMQGDTPSSALRRFIRGYVRRANGTLMSEANRRLGRRYALGAGLVIVAMTAAGAWLWSSTSLSLDTQSRFLSAENFSVLDFDDSGSIEGEELGHKAQHLLRVLDVNGQPGIQLSEAVQRARMSYLISDTVELAPIGENDTVKADIGSTLATLVEFDLMGGPSVTIYMQEGGGGGSRPDRMVLWETDAVRPKLVMGNADVASPKSGK